MSRKKRPTGREWQPMKPGDLHLDPFRLSLMKVVKDVPSAVWVNDRYTVLVYDCAGGMTHLSIRRADREWPRDWRHFQRIKNEICGPEREGAELYPAESRLLDGANQFHVWVLPLGLTFPFGYENRSVLDHNDDRVAGIGGKQRPLEEVS